MQVLEKKRALGAIEVLRLIAALGVMLSHVGYGFYYAKSFNSSIGVNLFFCISAFLMMHNTQNALSKNLFIRRIIRLVPLYWLLTILTFLASYCVSSFGQARIPIDELVKSLFFIPYARDGFKQLDVVRPIIGPAWTMNHDFWFLVICVISIKISRRYRGLIAAAVCILVRVVSNFLPEDLAIQYFMHRNVWYCYAAGIGIHQLWLLTKKITPNWKMLPILGWGVCLLLLGLLYFTPQTFWKTLSLCAAIVFVVLFACEHSRVPGIVSWFGSISYSFYLIHYYVIMIFSVLFDFTKFSALTVVGTIAATLVSLLISQISYYILEKKLGSYLKRKLVR